MSDNIEQHGRYKSPLALKPLMSLELLFKPKTIEAHPSRMFFYAILFASLGVILSLRIFPRYASIIIVTFTVIPLVPIMVRLIEDDEREYERRSAFRSLFTHHFSFKVYGYL